MTDTPSPDAGGAGTGIGWDRILGVASALLAAPPLIAPGPVAALIGVGDGAPNRAVLRAVAAREAAAAVGLLTVPRRWMLWGRVAGDAMDLALLGNALAGAAAARKPAAHLARTAAVTALVTGIAAVDVFAAARGAMAGSTFEATGAVTVNRPVQECFAFWRDLERLPEFMAHLEEVRVAGGGRSQWRSAAPFGRTLEWDADTVREAPGEELAWRSLPGSAVRHEGSVRFGPSPDGGTEVRVTILYGGVGPVGRTAARWAGEEPRQQLDDDLRRFKQVMETGEVIRSDGALDGKRARSEFPQRPAQPPRPGEAA